MSGFTRDTKHYGDARVRGTEKINADFRMLTTTVNLARLATLGPCFTPAGWPTA
ncbi:MAG: hypothetical protein ACRDRK_02610 [Pseudonocardia sp.]